MKRSSTRSPRLAASAALALALALAAGGCVSLGAHRDVVEQRDQLALEKSRLEQQVKLLEHSTRSLDSERANLAGSLEDLQQQRAALEADIARLRRSEEELAQHVAERDAKLSELQSLKGTYDALVSDLEAEVAAGQIQIEQLREGLRVNLSQEILFPSGSAALSAGGRDVLRKVAGQLRAGAHLVEVQGHTDDVPIRTERFASNWDLAAARATEVVRLLEQAGVSAARLSAVSFGATRPVAPNTSAEGRARNRRIELRLAPAPRTPSPDAGPKPAA
jgi:chemotaxis protein MotB